MRKLGCFVLFFALGVGLGVYLLSGIWLWIAAALAAAALPLFLLFRGRARLRWALGCSGLCSGLLYFLLYTLLLLSPALSYAGQTAALTATVKDYPVLYSYSGSVDVSFHAAGPLPVTLQVKAPAEQLEGLIPGDRLSLHGELSSALEKGSYSYGRVLILQADSLALTGHGAPGPTGWGAMAANRVKQVLASIFPGKVSPLAIALITGDKTAYNQDSLLANSFQTAGLAHIVAVSGLHMTYLLAIPAYLVRNRRRYACIAAPLVLFFMAFAGFTPSVCRAGIMCLFPAFSSFFRRQADTLTSLAAALLVLLAANPYAAASISLQLSFASVLGIVLLAGPINRTLNRPLSRLKGKKKKWLSYPAAALSVSLGSLAATLPLSAIYFGRISLVAPLVSLLTFALISLAFLLTLLACLAGLAFLPLGTAAALPAALLLRLIMWIARLFSGFSFAALYTDNPYVVLWVVALYLTLLLLICLKAPLRRWLVPGCGLLLSLCLVLLLPRLLPQRSFSITALDVGQGQCLVLRLGTRTAVLDCGSSSGEDAAEILLSYLREKGLGTIDLLMLTHYHADHCGGVEELLVQAKVTALVLPPADEDTARDDSIRRLASEQGSQIYTVESNPLHIAFGQSDITVYPPLADASENERCLAYLCSYQDFDLLVTGDMPESCERQLTEYARLPDTEVLLVGHHGSPSSTCQTLLEAARPDIAIISVGENSYGHPSDEVLARLSRFGTAVFRTDILGHITITSDWEAYSTNGR